MKLISLTKGQFAIVDDCDFEMVSKFKWHLKISTGLMYAARWIRRQDGSMSTQSIHRFLMGVDDTKIQVDHVNHNGLDNRRENLRIASSSQNCKNQRIRSNNKSGYKGVYFDKRSRKFVAQYGMDGRLIGLGRFSCPMEAARHYNRAAKENGEGFEFLNNVDPLFPTEDRITKQDYDANRVAATKERTEKYLLDLAAGLHTEKHTGVTFNKKRGKWTPVIKRKRIGFYLTKDEAISAYNKAKNAPTD